MKMIKLLSSAYVNGTLRHPHEGVLALDDAEADRLVANSAGTDVTGDFKAKQLEGVVPEALTADQAPAPVLTPEPHQAAITPNVAEGDAIVAAAEQE